MKEQTVPGRVALIGYPVGHSRSPAMHNAAFHEMGLNWEYLLLPVRPEYLIDAVRGLRAFGFAGANVTVPHKQAVTAALDEVTAEAQIIGAVNTIVIKDGKLIGQNTDALGFLHSLREANFEPRGERVVLLGAGGASRAVLYALLVAQAEVTVVNRTLARAQALAAELGERFKTEVRALSLNQSRPLQEAIDRATLIVNATTVGMYPHVDESPLPPSLSLRDSHTVCDLVYNPLETRLLTQARSAGARGIDGMGMLVHQGAAAFTLWTGLQPPVKAMRAAAMGEATGIESRDSSDLQAFRPDEEQ